jgi:hypothetical protein
MTARSTNEQLLERQEEAANEKYGVSPQQARSYVREGRQLLVESVAPQDRAFMFAQVLTCLQQDRMDAKEAGNISAQVGASKAMVNHLKQIAHIDPMRDFEHAFIEAAARQTGRPPRTHIIKEERAQRLEQELDALGNDASLNELAPF